MEVYQWIHPAVAILTLSLLTATAFTKMRSKKYFRLHYTLALTTVIGVTITFGLAVYTVVRCDCADDWPASFFVHLSLALLLMVFVLTQATMGVSMLLFGRKRRLFRAHQFNARIVLGTATLVLLLGLTTVVLLLAD